MRELQAKRIPDIVRSERLLVPEDPIANAMPVSANPYMQLLFAIWSEYVEPHSDKNDMYCNICLQKILFGFTEMKPFLIKLEQNNNKLKML